MKFVVLLLSTVLLASATHDYSFPRCYMATADRCSTTQPAEGAWSTVTYCPTSGMWLSIPCDQYEALRATDWGCYNGYVYTQDPSKIGGPGCIAFRSIPEPEPLLEERLAYTICPVTGSTKTVCCYSPSTCHTSSNALAVCY